MAKTEKRNAPGDVEVLPAVVAEEKKLTTQAGATLTAFVSGLSSFWKKAEALEHEARGLLASAKIAKVNPPTNSEQDERIQLRIKEAKALSTRIEKEWAITSVVYNLHKLLVSVRQRGAKAADDAAEILQALHNRYADDAREAARRETEKNRLEAEARERKRLDDEAEDAEKKALKLEAGSPDLSEREAIFVDQIVAGTSASEAARRAGYKNPADMGARLLDAPKVKKAIEAKRKAASLREQAATQRAAPVAVEVEEVQADVTRAAGVRGDSTRWGAECIDQAATIEAFRSGKHGIPGDLFMVNPVKANEYGKSLHERIDLWPGMRHTKKTGTS